MGDFVSARVEKVARNGCVCSGWAWGNTGAVPDSTGKLHHPSCRCPGGVIGCREGHMFKPCPKHGTRR